MNRVKSEPRTERCAGVAGDGHCAVIPSGTDPAEAIAWPCSSFATATQWVVRLTEAKRQCTLETELERLSFIPLVRGRRERARQSRGGSHLGREPAVSVRTQDCCIHAAVERSMHVRPDFARRDVGTRTSLREAKQQSRLRRHRA